MSLNVNIFYSHDINDRMEIVNQRGKYISRIKYYGFYVNLYLIDDQFVEVFYNIHTNAIEEVELLDPSEQRLGLYTAGVDISDIFKK